MTRKGPGVRIPHLPPRKSRPQADLAFISGEQRAAFGAWAETWTDLDVGYVWTCRVNGDTTKILV